MAANTYSFDSIKKGKDPQKEESCLVKCARIFVLIASFLTVVVAVFLLINIGIFFDLFQKYSQVGGYIGLGIAGAILLMSIFVFSAACCHLNPCSKCAIFVFGVGLAILLLTVAALSFFGIWAMSALSMVTPESGASGFEKSLIEQRNNLVEGMFNKCCTENNPRVYNALSASVTSIPSSFVTNDTEITTRFDPGATLKLVADSIVNETSVENLCFWPRDLSPKPKACATTDVLVCVCQDGVPTYAAYLGSLYKSKTLEVAIATAVLTTLLAAPMASTCILMCDKKDKPTTKRI